MVAKIPQISSYAFSKALVPVLTVLLVASAFLIGVLWTKVSYLERGGGSAKVVGSGSGGSGAAVGESPISKENLKKLAKEAGLDEKKFTSCVDGGQQATAVDADLDQGNQLGVGGTPAFFVNGRLVSGAQPYSNFKTVLDFELSGGNWNKPTPELKNLIDSKSVSVEKKSVDLGNAARKGKANAPIVLIEFSDFECPFCGRFFSQTLSQIEKDYVDTGKVLFVYKHYPLTSIHTNAKPAAEASACAAEQGKFWEYHDQIFTAMNSRS